MTHLSPDLGMLSTQGFGVKVQAKRSMNCERARVTGVVDEYRNPQLLARVASENRNRGNGASANRNQTPFYSSNV
jgi:hypothetical protein